MCFRVVEVDEESISMSLYFFGILLPPSVLKRRNVSDLSVVSMGGNEKQMSDPYAEAVWSP